jgi:formylglycine-generating enzyme required for sulfatase activity
MPLIPEPLDHFLAHLPLAGIPVGVQELHWLRRVCTLQPTLDRQDWHDVLACTLAKTPAQRQAFDEVFETWYPDEAPAQPATELPEDIAQLEDTSAWEPAPHPVLTVDPAVSPAAPHEPPDPTRPESTIVPDRVAPRPVSLAYLAGTAMVIGLLATLWSWRQLLWRPIPMHDGVFLLLGSAIWASTYWLWRAYQQRNAPPDAAPFDPTGPAWQPLPALPALGVACLTPEDLRQMIWSIGRFVSEDRTRRLDLGRTVQATARTGGLPVLHYQSAVYPREVWLWVDTATPDLAMQRLVWEIRWSLERAGLPCRQGSFRELPDPVTWEEGESFTPASLEGHRQGALVLLLSNGEGLATAQALAPERTALTTLLYALAAWPQLAWVDVSQGAWGLAERVQPYALTCLGPEDVPAFLGAEGSKSSQRAPVSMPLAGDLKAWAAGLALSPDPVDAEVALALHQALRLAVPPWGLSVLREQGVALGPGHVWPLQERAVWVNWLVQAEAITGPVPQDSRLGQALTFWQARYPEATDNAEPSPAAQRFAMERALLDLWCAPERATSALYGIYSADPGGLGLEITQRLAAYMPRPEHLLASEPAAGVFVLPWLWHTISVKAQGLLYRLGLAGRWLTAPPRYIPGTLPLVLGSFIGVATALCLHSGGAGLGLLTGLVAATALVAQRLRRANQTADSAEPLDMVYIPGGTFTMGSAPEDEQAYEDEHPQHQVTVSDFFMARYLVTQPQYRRAMGQRIWHWHELHPRRQPWYTLHPRVPVTDVSWFDAIALCNALSDQQGLQRCYVQVGDAVLWDQEAEGYRLPTEAEWEYAARAGTTTRWGCGDAPTDLGRFAWYAANAGGRGHPVGTKQPNAWGLADMAGNVYEWCWDRYGPYPAEAVADPAGPADGAWRVLRGGAYWYGAGFLRSAHRNGLVPEFRRDDVGVRVVRRPRRPS